MSENVISSSSNSIDKTINEYHDTTSYSGSSSTSNSSSGGNSTDEGYTSSVPEVPLLFKSNLGKGQPLGLTLALRRVFLHLVL